MFDVNKIITQLQDKLERQRAAIEATENHIAFLEAGKGDPSQVVIDLASEKAMAEIEDSKEAAGKPSKK